MILQRYELSPKLTCEKTGLQSPRYADDKFARPLRRFGHVPLRYVAPRYKVDRGRRRCLAYLFVDNSVVQNGSECVIFINREGGSFVARFPASLGAEIILQ
jgi:hypothetical protein